MCKCRVYMEDCEGIHGFWGEMETSLSVSFKHIMSVQVCITYILCCLKNLQI